MMIQVNQLTRYYGDLCAVNGISLKIEKGEIVGLLGPNGAGKTTTLRMLTGFLRPTSGDITVNGLSIHNDMPAIKRLMGYLPEAAPVYDDMLVYDYLVYVADVRGIRREEQSDRISRVAGMCGLQPVMHQPVAELSKGFRQRVGLAHAMIHDPEILVLDEPTSGLDPNQIVEIRDIIRQAGKEKTIIFSTHILSEAEATCDRIVIIDKGRIVADQATGELIAEAGGDRALFLSLAGADPETAKVGLAGVKGVQDVQVQPSDPSDPSGVVRLKLVCAPDPDPRRVIYAHIRQTDWDLLEFYGETQGLEHIFRKLTTEA
ncbi:ABC transporter ATP-binding protein [Desulfosudis oleivorans]|uniref:ABC transporter-related protein n=1 Tax=Desulfosudis oleivorans (strain DSM 6200 / JCM 39069 / Hxd3) TaxID=96561 RepID=A8ZTU1_DESOH|nr:ATP-binding cassette domain-containing protein [Desulfosudis oleivorans]ABW67874.1 ABC transporter-related protein [Desulfosudis oleivorans Hxd3]